MSRYELHDKPVARGHAEQSRHDPDEALTSSTQKWEYILSMAMQDRNEEAHEHNSGSSNCGLCLRYLIESTRGCLDCPLRQSEGAKGSMGCVIPYDEAVYGADAINQRVISQGQYIERVLGMVNSLRRAGGLPPLRVDSDDSGRYCVVNDEPQAGENIDGQEESKESSDEG